MNSPRLFIVASRYGDRDKVERNLLVLNEGKFDNVTEIFPPRLACITTATLWGEVKLNFPKINGIALMILTLFLHPRASLM
jgi:hypothetical protein